MITLNVSNLINKIKGQFCSYKGVFYLIEITLTSQRKLYKEYKETRLKQAHNLIALYNTGSYSRPKDSEIINDAKSDILSFVSVFEDRLIKEVENELNQIN